MLLWPSPLPSFFFFFSFLFIYIFTEVFPNHSRAQVNPRGAPCQADGSSALPLRAAKHAEPPVTCHGPASQRAARASCSEKNSICRTALILQGSWPEVDTKTPALEVLPIGDSDLSAAAYGEPASLLQDLRCLLPRRLLSRLNEQVTLPPSPNIKCKLSDFAL